MEKPLFGGKRLRELALPARRKALSGRAKLSSEEEQALSGRFPKDEVLSLSENSVGIFPLPLSVAENFRINGKAYLVPMAIEEPSVVAAAGNSAKLSLPRGFQAEGGQGIVVGQIQLKGGSLGKLLRRKGELLSLAEKISRDFSRRGGGARFLRARRIGKYSVVEIGFSSGDAMGANSINSICEGISGKVSDISGGEVFGRIITNFAPERVATAKAEWDSSVLYESFRERTYSGREIVERILALSEFAESDIPRAVTHNKGIMNGLSALAVATGNDWRAQEAGAHSFAVRNGKYSPLTEYRKSKRGIFGEIKIPVQMGIVGAPLRNPLARVSLKILGVKSAKEISCVGASLGLAQNFAALRVLATEGIQKGHMALAKGVSKNG